MKKSLLIFGTMLVITIAHYVSPPPMFLWHEVLERLYYLPIVFAAISFGLSGGLLAAVCAGLCYAPHIITAWNGSPQAMDAKYAEIVVFLAVGAVTGFLSDRERKRTFELQHATGQLRTVNAQFQNSLDQLKRADRLSAVGELAASLAHEIRNPLGSIEGAIDIAERTSSEEKRREFLAIIRKETKRLNGLLTNLLDFARPRSPQMRPTRIENIVKSVTDLTAHNAQQRGIRLESEISPNLPLVECDAEQITQALLNITLNALQMTPSGGAVSLSIQQQHDMVLMRVSDEGSGVDGTNLERIFEPFYTTKETGTGLGLSISYQILTQHGGGITAERNPGKGMTFTLTLPIRQLPSQKIPD
ncbi:MAG: ATP-binding protein [Acidobacteriota bacterium]